ncbi:helix-turn-helix transcriptional regulator [Cryptosporangium aurantiacum]|uniref:Helix-turn-helix domain-containing protein n=1 Tax=Cryptosporangium aurantiacum TaxID=134849 RepID=A0A1M7R7Y0_9ACTN|nr:helix-turn-helix transcriptional regulator [Cryptosporangium aurantiacum]SHN42414.1 Helix-turn-helix domain-containing protein [Cryptosporangium aurantiacum]
MDRVDQRSPVADAHRLAAALRQHRTRAGLTQRELALRVRYSRSSIANAEAGDVRAVDLYRRCDAALGTGGTLEAARRALGTAAHPRAGSSPPASSGSPSGPPDATGRTASREPGAAGHTASREPGAAGHTASHEPGATGHTASHEPDATGRPASRETGASGHSASREPGASSQPASREPRAGGRSASDSPGAAGRAAAAAFAADAPSGPVPVEEAIEHLRQHWHLLVRTDNLLGPQAALPTALDHLSTLATLLRTAAGPARTALLCLSVRYAETAAWLHQDVGQLDHATVWADRALDWAHEGDDRTALAWVLHRRSQLRAAGGDAAGALSLARAARRSGADADPPLAAALHVQQARAYAAVGDRRRCVALLRRAAALADTRETAGDGRAGYGGHCTRAWVLAHRGACALRFDAPAEAAVQLRTALAGLAPVYRRNRGLVTGWLAEAYARLGAADEALRAAAWSRAVGEATGSASVLAQAGAAEELARAAEGSGRPAPVRTVLSRAA